MGRKVINPQTAAALDAALGSGEFPVSVTLVSFGFEALTCGKGSPEWTRTTNPAINSRMLCQLSYGGPVARRRREAQYLIGSMRAGGRVDLG